jgi:DNA invertase Pin-like site-specific DNA recombinase
MNKQYFAYVRVSTVRQGERGSSLAEQKNAIEAYAARAGLPVVEWFEEMETAAKQGRRKFTQMLTQLRSGRAHGLIIHKIDRSARNLRDWADLGDLIDHGIDVRFVSDNFDMLSRGGRLSADIQAVVAADYIRNLRDEVKKGINGRLKQGIYPFAAPIGYLNTGKGNLKTIDPIKGPLVRHLFERYATNTVGFEALRHELAGLGLLRAAGKPLLPNSLSRIFNNPFYMGVIRIRRSGETFQGAHEPLISKTLYDVVQAILHGKTVPKTKRHQFLFRNLVKCDNCGRRTLSGETQKAKVYYRCHARTCPGVSWRGDTLEGIALNHIRRIRVDEHGLRDLRDLVENEYHTREAANERIKTSCSLRLRLLDDRMTRLTDLLIDNAIDQLTFNQRKEKLLAERLSLQEQLGRTQGRSPLENLFEEFERNNRELLRYETLLDDEKRELIDIVCSNFAVSGKEAVFTLRTPYMEIAEAENSSACGHRRDDVRTLRIFNVLNAVAEAAIESGERPVIGPAWRRDTQPSPFSPRRQPVDEARAALQRPGEDKRLAA